MSVCLSGAKGGHYQSEGFVCLSVISRAFADNRADAVDRLLITKCDGNPHNLSNLEGLMVSIHTLSEQLHHAQGNAALEVL